MVSYNPSAAAPSLNRDNVQKQIRGNERARVFCHFFYFLLKKISINLANNPFSDVNWQCSLVE